MMKIAQNWLLHILARKKVGIDLRTQFLPMGICIQLLLGKWESQKKSYNDRTEAIQCTFSS